MDVSSKLASDDIKNITDIITKMKKTTKMTKVVLYPLPHKCKGFCHESEDGSQIVVLNSRLTREANIITYTHEISHADDFGKALDVNKLEKIRHE